MIKSGKQYYLYNASWICQNGWPWLPPPPHHLYIWPSDTLRVWGAPVSQPFMSLTPSFTCNHKRPQLSCFFFFCHKSFWLMGEKQKKLSQLLLITQCCSFLFSFISVSNAWEMKNEKKKYLLQQKLIHLLTEAVGAYQNFHLSRILRCNS